MGQTVNAEVTWVVVSIIEVQSGKGGERRRRRREVVDVDKEERSDPASHKGVQFVHAWRVA